MIKGVALDKALVFDSCQTDSRRVAPPSRYSATVTDSDDSSERQRVEKRVTECVPQVALGVAAGRSAVAGAHNEDTDGLAAA